MSVFSLCLYSHLKAVNLNLMEYCHWLYLGTIYNFRSQVNAMIEASGAVTLGLLSFFWCDAGYIGSCLST